MRRLVVGRCLTLILIVFGAVNLLAATVARAETVFDGDSQPTASPESEIVESVKLEEENTLITTDDSEELDKIEDPETPLIEPVIRTPQVGDLRFIKFQTGDQSMPSAAAMEYAVIMNFSSEDLDLAGVSFEIYGSSTQAKLQFALPQHHLAPGEKLYLLHEKILGANYPASFWSEVTAENYVVFTNETRGLINKTLGRLRLVYQETLTSEPVELDQLSYQLGSLVPEGVLALASQHELFSCLFDEVSDQLKYQGEKLVWQTYLTNEPEPAWLALNELPIWEAAIDDPSSSEPTSCPVGYEMGFTDTCVRVCSVGYERNPETKRCRKIVVEAEPVACPIGSYRNLETGRCNKLISATKAVLAPCPVGYERNPSTNRCRKISNQQDCDEGYEIGFTGTCVKKCHDGYERSLETNRCRKIITVASAEDLSRAMSDDVNTSQTTSIRLEWYQVILLVIALPVTWGIVNRQQVLKWWRQRKRG